jgi:hypothetical protein
VNEEIGNGSTFKFQAMLIDLFNKLRFLMQGKIPRNSGMMLFCEMGRGIPHRLDRRRLLLIEA